MIFPGYPAPTSNYTYTPNQYFDVLLPHFSRGAVRLSAYIIRKSLGWCDQHSKPQEAQVYITHNIAIREANVGRDAVRLALDELIKGRIIVCLKEPRVCTSAQDTGEGGLYMLRWDKTKQYTRNPEKFQGFCAGGGNMTHIPNLYFDVTVKFGTLSLAQVVGTVLRNTIGYEDEDGWRRRQVSLSQKQIKYKMNISSDATVNKALKFAKENGHLIEEHPGYFDTNAGRESRPAVYSVRWSDGWKGEPFDSTAAPAPSDQEEGSRKSVAGVTWSEKCSGVDSRKSVTATRSEKCSRSSLKNVAETQSEKCSDIEIKEETNNIKQQHETNTDPAAVKILFDAGFDDTAAKTIASSTSLDTIKKQIKFFKFRYPDPDKQPSNPLGALRSSIEGEWAPPPSFIENQKKLENIEKAQLEVKRAKHKKEFEQAWNEYKEGIISSIKSEDPEAWYLFEESETSFVEQIKKDNLFYRTHPNRLDDFLARHMDDHAVLERACKFFADRYLDFWDWDRDLNQLGMSKKLHV
ncbi:MAG: hypothetical protein ACYC0V_10750 [Armatimonadota bacterium]